MSFLGIDAEVIPHSAQRYPTCGDWQWEILGSNGEIRGQKLQLNVSDTGDMDSNFLIMIHEAVEAYLCLKYGIREKDVDEWDMTHPDSDDPGSLPGCPYLVQHTIATSIEVLLGASLRRDWIEHCRRIEELFKENSNDSEINDSDI